MRELTSVKNETDARRLVAYLSVQSIECQWEIEDGLSTIWIVNDDDREAAIAILKEFEDNPADERFENAERKVRHVLKEADRLREEQGRRQHRKKMRQSGAWWYCYPATFILIGLCVAVCILCTNLSDQRGQGLGPARGRPGSDQSTTSVLRSCETTCVPPGLPPLELPSAPAFTLLRIFIAHLQKFSMRS